MKKQFSNGVFGYDKKQVNRCLEELTRDYEEELSKKKDRLMELLEENHQLKQKVKEQNEQICAFTEKEKYISSTLIEAEQRSQAIIEQGRMKSMAEMAEMKEEKRKWKDKFREVRRELIELEKNLEDMMQRFHDEINYYTAKEVSESILTKEGTAEEEKENEEREKVIA